MAFRRAYHTLTMLPDGNVLVTSGGSTTEGKNVSAAVKQAELWSPATETWQTMATAAVPRIYHGTAVLLADGRVVVAGSGDSYGGPDQTTAEFYSPPYLFRGARPSIATAPAVLAYRAGFSVALDDATPIVSVALVRPGAVTHQFDEDQRYLALSFSQNGSALAIDGPASESLAPPGYYMLFVLNGAGVPSTARWVRLPAPATDSQSPTPPTTLTADGSLQTISLNWNGATDNVAVTSYNVHRSATSGFTPATGNRVAQPTGTSYTDNGLTPGPYFYKSPRRTRPGT